jgi:hypothetical protein
MVRLRWWRGGRSKTIESKARSGRTWRCCPKLECLEDRTLPSTIVWANRGGLGSDTDNFNAVFGSQATAARAEVDAALSYWQNAIQNFNYADGSNSLRLTISVNPTDHSNDATTLPGLLTDGQGKPKAALIQLGAGTDGHGGGYFIDPTPYDSSEYQRGINAYAADAFRGTSAWGGADLLTLVLHETTHAVGLNADPREAFQQNLHGYLRSTGQGDGADSPGSLFTFTGPDVRALFTSDDGDSADLGRATHLARPGNSYTDPATHVTYTGGWDVLNPVYYLGRRTLVSPTDVLVLEDAYGYTVNMPGTLTSGPVAPTPAPVPTPAPAPTPPAPPATPQPSPPTGLPPWMVAIDQYLQRQAAQQQTPPATPPAPPKPPTPPPMTAPSPAPAPPPPAPIPPAPPATPQPSPPTGLPPWMVAIDQYLQRQAAQQQTPPAAPPAPPKPPSPPPVTAPSPAPTLPPWMVTAYRYLHRPIPGGGNSLGG